MPKAFTPNVLLYNELPILGEGVKAKNGNWLTRTREGGRFLHTACTQNLTHGPHSKTTDAAVEKNYFSTTHTGGIQRMGSKTSRILPPRDADKKTATWARPVAV